MTGKELKALPWLLSDHQVIEVTGYAANTLRKLVDCSVLAAVQPKGCGVRRFRKAQVAQMVGLDLGELGAQDFVQEPLLMAQKGVWVWTGYDEKTLVKMVTAGGLQLVKPPGLCHGKYRKAQVATLIGLERYV